MLFRFGLGVTIGLLALLVAGAAMAAPARLSDVELDQVTAGTAGDLEAFQRELLTTYVVPYLRAILARLETTEQIGSGDLQADLRAFLGDYDTANDNVNGSVNGSIVAIQARSAGPPASDGTASARAIESVQPPALFDVMSLGAPAVDGLDITMSTYGTSDSAGGSVRVVFSVNSPNGGRTTVQGGGVSASLN